jgi:histone H3/H4
MARIKSKEIIRKQKTIDSADLKKAIKEGEAREDATETDKPKIRRLRKKGKERRLRKEQRRLQACANMLMPKAAMSRVIRSVLDEHNLQNRVTQNAFDLLHAATEAHLHDILSEAYALSVRVGKRPTLMPEEIRIVNGIFTRCADRFKSVLPITYPN